MPLDEQDIVTDLELQTSCTSCIDGESKQPCLLCHEEQSSGLGDKSLRQHSPEKETLLLGCHLFDEVFLLLLSQECSPFAVPPDKE